MTKTQRKERLLEQELRIKGFNRERAAKKLGVTEITLHNWIHGHYRINADACKILKKIGIDEKAIRNPSELV
ncbi:MAG: hypothetical protein GY941_23525 [Planctomycetes bacterium]|nr:hypothetical protein [Planctomycetota bacterium]